MALRAATLAFALGLLVLLSGTAVTSAAPKAPTPAGASAPAAAAPAAPDQLEQARSLMAGRRFEEAATALAAYKGDQAAKAAYLRAVALLRAGDGKAALAAAETVATVHEKTAFGPKARMLRAFALMDQKRYKDAEALLRTEAQLILSDERKREIAGIYLDLAQAAAEPKGRTALGGQEPDFDKALRLYEYLVEQDVPKDVLEKAWFRRAECALRAQRFSEAVNHYRAYLDRFDARWRTEMTGQTPGEREADGATGAHLVAARLGLVEAALRERQALPPEVQPGSPAAASPEANDASASAVEPWVLVALDNLLTHLRRRDVDAKDVAAREGLDRALYYRPFAAGLRLAFRPDQAAGPVSPAAARRAVALAREFVAAYPKDLRSAELLLAVGRALSRAGFPDEAQAAWAELTAGKTLTLDRPEDKPRYAALQARALYAGGEALLQAARPEDAAATWERYVAAWPDGADWKAAQEGIVRALGALGARALADKKYDEARKTWEGVLQRRAMGEQAGWLALAVAGTWRAEGQHQRALDELLTVARRYPGAVAAEATFQRGELYRRELKDLEGAVREYQASGTSEAQAALAELQAVELTATVPRVFRTNEAPFVEVALRNVSKLQVRVYRVNLQDFFRKYHTTEDVRRLDLDLVSPDKTWEDKVPDYAPYRDQTRKVSLDLPAGPGAWAVTVDAREYEATVLVVRSDLELVATLSQGEAVALAKDALTEQPRPGAQVLVWGGPREAQGLSLTAGKDGVARGRFAEKPADAPYLFASHEGHVAVAGCALPQVAAATLAPRGFLYPSRPVYLPGERVPLRGVVRSVKDGAYVPAAGASYKLTLTGPDGVVLDSRVVELGRFGTFTAELRLPPNSALGRYSVAVAAKTGSEAYATSFQVQRVEPSKVFLELLPSALAVVAGDPVEIKLRAAYYTGLPLAGRALALTLPDGRTLTLTTDAKGEATYALDTTPFHALPEARLRARVAGEDAAGAATIQVLPAALALQVTLPSPRATAGERYEVALLATTPDGKPAAGRAVRARVYAAGAALELPIPARVLSQAGVDTSPLERGRDALVAEETLTTSAEGRATLSFVPKDPGDLRLAFAAKDDKGRELAEVRSLPVDKKATPHLALAVKEATVQVGQEVRVTVKNDDKPGLGLVLFAGDTVLGYRVHRFERGEGALPYTVGNEHFPNFTLTALATGDHRLNRADQAFTVVRRLEVQIKLPDGPLAPGATVEAEVTVRDQAGQPQAAELSLSMVDQGLLAKYPDESGNMVSFFEEGLKRRADFAACSSVTFERKGEKQAVAKEVLEEQTRLEEDARRAGARRDLAAREKKSLASPRSMSAMAPPSPAMLNELSASCESVMDADDEGMAYGGAMAKGDVMQQMNGPMPSKARRQLHATGRMRGAKDGKEQAGEEGNGEAEAASPRRELAIGAFWLGNVVTGADGRGTARIVVPERTTRYRLQLRAVTEQTLLGEREQEVVVRRDLFAELKLPPSLMEGDQVQPVVSVHNAGDFTGPVEVKLELTAAGSTRPFPTTLTLKGKGVTEALLGPWTVPAARAVAATLTVVAGGRTVDRLEREVAVRPWGVEERAGRVGRATDAVKFTLALPPAVRPGSAALELALWPSVGAAVLDMLDEPEWGPPTHRATACRVLAMLAARGAGGASDPLRSARLSESIRAAVTALISGQQRDGSWSLVPCRDKSSGWSDASATAWCVLAIDAARRAGTVPAPQAWERAVQWLKGRAGASDASDETLEALYALSACGQAEFTQLNRLFRERARLSLAGRALLGLAFRASDKADYAGQLADDVGRALLGAARSGAEGRDRALGLLLLTSVGGRDADAARLSALVAEDATGLRLGGDGRWLGLAALTAAAGRSAAGPPAFTVAVKVNGRAVQTYEAKAGAKPARIRLEAADLGGLPAVVELGFSGRGELAWRALLSGFSPVPERSVRFHYGLERERAFHSPKLYQGRRLCDSSMEVKDVAFDDHVEDLTEFEGRQHGESPGGYAVLTKFLPAGLTVDRTSIPAEALAVEEVPGRLTLVFRDRPSDFRLRLLPGCPGVYRVLPAELSSASRPGAYERLGGERTLTVLAPGKRSDEPYRWALNERIGFGTACFNDQDWKGALEHLGAVPKDQRKHYRDVVRSLLWIFCLPDHYQGRAADIVDLFEIMAQRYSDVSVPYDKLLVIGRAYHDAGEDEAACYLWRSTLESSFRDDVPVAAELEQAGEYLRAVEYLRALYWRYPDLPTVVQGLYGLSQDIYNHKEKARELKLLPEEVVARALDVLKDFLAMFPSEAYADEATFSLLNALRDLGAHEACLGRALLAVKLYPKSELLDRFRYLRALAAFGLGRFEEAVDAAAAVARGDGEDSKNATFLLAQMYQALGRHREALATYKKVAEDFADAKLAIEYLERRSLKLPEVVTGTAGEPVQVEVTYCNVPKVEVMAYRVDLMRLYLKEKNLDRVAGVNLAGITPTFTFERSLPEAPPGVTATARIDLPIKEVGAYLVLARSGETFASGLTLVSPLTMEVQEYQGAARVTTLQGTDRKPAQGVFVRASAGGAFAAAESDLRGCATLSVEGDERVTVVARRGKDEYAFWRSPTSPDAERPQAEIPEPEQVAYDRNLMNANMEMQQRAVGQLRGFFERRSRDEQGVKASVMRR